MNHLYILLTILFTVYGQIIIKWQVQLAGAFPQNGTEKVNFIIKLLLNPWVMSSFVCAFLAALSWMAAMTKFPLSYAYPFMSLAFVLVMFLSALFFKEPVTIPKTIGLALIILGIVIGSKG
ncbi:EamA family transporter [Gimesia fumaroli]|uniref:Putative 4-amino-4-deoxy-L-arabinose-phosphoundecaprenol flippase subunit ArnF n=1 Tax=Gimesia fumaroli TaxID=2527976 RepID=A0A518IDN4_9PLAN|nr:EamA family transporter [Gimesia fumaroli]QDV51211.1 putative 4-amino-4-deoxy-L-arabinose-phosphoundecaprenol flippase subunit ArnF [Gimesia fumaroli]